MVELVDLQAAAYIAQIIGVVGTLTAAFIAVRSYINANKRAEEAKKKEQETRDRELETRQAQLFMQIYNRWDEEYTISFWKIMNAKIGTWQELWSLQETDERLWKDFSRLGMFYEGLGTLVKMDLLDIRYVAYFIASTIRMFWEKIAPFKDVMRESTFTRNLSETEYLYNRLMKYLDEHPELKT